MEEKPGRNRYSLSRGGSVGDSGSLPKTGVSAAVGVWRTLCMEGSQRWDTACSNTPGRRVDYLRASASRSSGHRWAGSDRGG